ncbi:MAG: hypothetical protein EA357_00180 [Micavibrio sp.]|nr:MAG: hypothetical protein EA357_00180 [Micavibrio sp.]
MTKTAQKTPAKDNATLIFRVSIYEDWRTDCACIREIEITPEKTLEKLAQGIIRAFDFDFDHAFGFYSSLEDYYNDAQERYELFVDMDVMDGVETENRHGGKLEGVMNTCIRDVFPTPGKQMQFIFDYGDEWRFLVELTGYGNKTPGSRYPKTVRKTGVPPPQYADYDEDEA